MLEIKNVGYQINVGYQNENVIHFKTALKDSIKTNPFVKGMHNFFLHCNQRVSLCPPPSLLGKYVENLCRSFSYMYKFFQIITFLFNCKLFGITFHKESVQSPQKFCKAYFKNGILWRNWKRKLLQL